MLSRGCLIVFVWVGLFSVGSVEASGPCVPGKAAETLHVKRGFLRWLRTDPADIGALAKALAKSSWRVSIEGHTDSRGSGRFNMIRSKQKAMAVRKALIKRGIPAGRLLAVGFGESRPVASNRSRAGRRENNRIEFHYRCGKAGSSAVVRPRKRMRMILRIHFRTEKQGLTRSHRKKLKKIARMLKRRASLSLSIEGHSAQGEQQGRRRGLARATRVRQFLEKRGIPSSRLQIKGYGSMRPLGSNRTAAGRRKNRRVELYVSSM